MIDEFDTFIDSGNEENIRRLLDGFLGSNDGRTKNGDKRQVVFASATVSKFLKKLASDYFGQVDPERGNQAPSGYKELIEKSTHMNLSNLKHEFIHIADYDKIKPLKLLMKDFKKYARKHNTSCIVFCNSVQSARAIEHTLAEDGFKTASMHGDIPPRNRERNFLRFKTQEEGT